MNASALPSRRGFRRRGSWALWLLWALVAAWISWRTVDGPLQGPATHDLEPPVEGEVHVHRVVDGDTLLLDGGRRLRLIGVDSPETVKADTPVQPWGPEATQFTREFIGDGRVRLQFDTERADRFGRWLAYVWVGDRLLNEELLRVGLARWEPHYHYSAGMKTRFRRAEESARAAHRGIWSAQPAPPARRH